MKNTILILFLIFTLNSFAQYDFNARRKIEDSIKTAKFNEATNKLGIGLMNSGFQESKFGTVSLSLQIINAGTKTIKYVYLTVKIINPVDDPIASKTVTCVGPIAGPYQSKDYLFENLFYTKQFGSGSITKLKIQFMDGTFKEIPPNEISSIILNL